MSSPHVAEDVLKPSRITAVWLLLCGATAISWCFGIERVMYSRRAAAVIILTIAMLKVRLVMRFFMNVRTAPWMLKIVCDLCVLFMGVAVIGFYWMGSS